MKVFKIEYIKGYSGSDSGTKNVLAKDAAQAVEFFLRYAKKNYYSSAEVVGLSVITKIDVNYK